MRVPTGPWLTSGLPIIEEPFPPGGTDGKGFSTSPTSATRGEVEEQSRGDLMIVSSRVTLRLPHPASCTLLGGSIHASKRRDQADHRRLRDRPVVRWGRRRRVWRDRRAHSRQRDDPERGSLQGLALEGPGGSAHRGR